MIPQKIILEGFLCYRTRQEIDLTDLRLCMLHGPNGSGKSTVFDAITFALFGSHRGGSRNLDDLIHKKCDSARIIFEFILEDTRWQIYRTIKRGVRGARSTGDVRKHSQNGIVDEWEVVPDTSSSDGLANWVTARLAMSGKAFTRSMLLRQGESDRLLSCEPRERFEVLAGIAELEKYQALEKSAGEHRRCAEGEVEKLAAQLAAIEPVREEDVNEAARQAGDLAAQRKATDEDIASLQERLHQARLFSELRAKVQQATQKQNATRERVLIAPKIEADYHELITLSTVLPQLSVIVEQRQKTAGCEAQVRVISRQLEQKRETLEATLQESKSAQDICSRLESQIPRLETAHGTLTQQIAASRRMLDIAQATGKQRCALREIEVALARLLAKHPNPEAQASAAKDEAQALTLLCNALPALEQFLESRRDGWLAVRRQAELAASKIKRAAEWDVLKSKFQFTQQDLQSAESAGRETQNSETEARTLLNRAKAALAELDKANGHPDCPTCGQALTEAHLQQEKVRRQAEHAAWTKHHIAAVKVRQQAEALVKNLRRTAGESEKLLREHDEQIRSLDAALQTAAEDQSRSARDCKRTFSQLPEDLRRRMDPRAMEDGTDNPWPADDDINQLRQQAAGLPAAEDRIRQSEGVCAEWRKLTTQRLALGEALAAHSALPSEGLPTLEQEHARLESEQNNAALELKEARDSLRLRQKEIKSMAGRVQAMEAEIGKLTTAFAVEQANRSTAAQAADSAFAQLPADWTDRANALTIDSLNAFRLHARSLDERGVREAFNQLNDSRSALAVLEERLKDLQNDIDRIPPAARQEPQVFVAQLDQATAGRAEQLTALQAAQLRTARLEADRQRRLELEQSLRQADRQLRHLKVLVELLGKRRLQLHLVRQTERKIVECANHILERLSAGDLLLQLRQSDDEKSDPADQALDLLAIHRATGGTEPIPVAFLSGSQRFRVAVSLALAIGQVAGNHRHGECVIIDEGFGSLDRQGQEVMIQELQRLQGIMKRIILVSHQESFADAFPNGYRFSIHDGEARVQRMIEAL